MTNKTYDTLKWIAQIFLPALATLYVTLAQIWPMLPDEVKISATIMAFDFFLGVLLGIQKKRYDAQEPTYDGRFIVHYDEDGDPIKVDQNLNEEPLSIINKDEVRMKVVKKPFIPVEEH